MNSKTSKCKCSTSRHTSSATCAGPKASLSGSPRNRTDRAGLATSVVGYPQSRRDTWSLIERVRDSGVTILLVTHLMDEAERLCDRIAVIDGGRVAALDTPAGLIAAASVMQQVRFRLSRPLDKRLLTELPEVSDVEITEGRYLVTGSGQLLGSVAGALARAEIVAEDLGPDVVVGRARADMHPEGPAADLGLSDGCLGAVLLVPDLADQVVGPRRVLGEASGGTIPMAAMTASAMGTVASSRLSR